MSSKYSDRPYTVGKGKPPVHTQFGKDRLGNTAGRPPGARNVDTIVTGSSTEIEKIATIRLSMIVPMIDPAHASSIRRSSPQSRRRST